jgi:hypothetical protein
MAQTGTTRDSGQVVIITAEQAQSLAVALREVVAMAHLHTPKTPQQLDAIRATESLKRMLSRARD